MINTFMNESNSKRNYAGTPGSQSYQARVKRDFKKIIIGTAIIGGLIGGYFLIKNAVNGEETSAHPSSTSEQIPGSASESLAESNSQSYEDLVKIVAENIDQNPEYANLLIQRGINAIEVNKQSYDSETYLQFFNIIVKKAEEKPELLEYFGPKAKAYARKNALTGYVEEIEKEGSKIFNYGQRKD